MMRLTLRTLLAYLDDILSPADTATIGQKIQESPMAQVLVSRIREVMRRRRLTSPEVFGPEMGIDPNIVSQYLDNTLPPERYADVERVLLASDEMLAEAAACHQVLALILGEPAELPLASRERLYALGPVDASSQLTVPEPKPTRSGRTPHSIATQNGSGTAPHSPQRSSQDDERITTLPDYLKPAPLSQRVFPSAVVALLVVLCLALLGPDLMKALRTTNTDLQRKVEREKNTTAMNEANQPVEAENAAGKPADQNMENVVPPEPAAAVAASSKLPQGIDPTPPKDADEGAPSKTAVADVDDQPPASALFPSKPGKEVAMADAKVAPKTKPETAPVVPTESLIAYSSADGVLIRYDDAMRHWFRVPHRTPLAPGSIVANLEPFESIVDFESAGVRATLIGETVVKLLVAIEAGLSGQSVGRGRILFQSARTDDKPPAAIGVAVGEDIWKLDLGSRDTVCGLEVTVRESTQFQKVYDFQWYQATLYVVSGSVKWTNKSGATQEINEHMSLNIIPERSTAVRSTPISFPSPPDWCDAIKRRAIPLRKMAPTFEKSFVTDEPVDESMLTLVKSTRSPKIAELAARCLSATDNYVGLVEALAECTHEEARVAARDGLREWLPMSPEHGPRLKAELDSHYPPADAEAIYRMLWGFSRDDVKDSKANSWLFTNWMRNPKLEIRELAYYWVDRLSGRRRLETRASGPATLREPQIRRLEEQIERENGLIKGQ